MFLLFISDLRKEIWEVQLAMFQAQRKLKIHCHHWKAIKGQGQMPLVSIKLNFLEPL